VEEVAAIVERLDRIERLRRGGAPAPDVLDELRALLGEAEAWSRLEGGEAGARAVERLRAALERDAVVS
jgi:hypothetical protein